MMIDKEMVKKRFHRSMATYNHEALVQKNIAKELIGKVFPMKGPGPYYVLEIGCGTGILTHELLKKQHPHQYVLNDLVGQMQYEIEKIASKHRFTRWSFIEGDAEKIKFPGHFDLIISSSTVQWFQNPAHFFGSIHKSLKTNGILAISTFGNKNFREIKATLSTGLTYPSITQLKTWLSPFFTEIEIQEKIIPMHFSSPREVLKHIGQTGVNGVGNKYLGKSGLLHFEENYQKAFSQPDHTLSLTYHPITIVAKKKEPNE